MNFFDLDQVPKPSELDDIWFYMNFRLNFSRLMRETRPIKLQQQLTWLSHVCNKTAPDNALIIYFYAYLQHKVLGQMEPELVARLQERVAESTYWQERFALFGLSPDHVANREFPTRFDCGEIPSELPAKDAALFQFRSEPIVA